MQNYLSQLALRVQQPELAIRPRPLSLFESPDYSNHAWSNSFEFREPTVIDVFDSYVSSGPFSPGRPDADQSTHHNIRDRSRSKLGRTELIPDAGSMGNVDQPYRTPLGDRPPVEHSKGNERQSVRPYEHMAMGKPARQLSPWTISAAREVIGEGGDAEQAARTPQSSASQSSSKRRPPTVQMTQGVQGEYDTAKLLSNMNQPVDPPHRDANGSTVSFSCPSLTERQTPSQNESLQAHRSFERKTGMILSVPPRESRETFAPLAGSGDVHHAMERVANSPTIQVTIGRVEIRATVASAPTRKTPTHKQTMSLDDYLKQRNGSRG